MIFQSVTIVNSCMLAEDEELSVTQLIFCVVVSEAWPEAKSPSVFSISKFQKERNIVEYLKTHC